MCPKEIQAVAEGCQLDQGPEDRHEDVGLDREHVIFQRDVFEFFLPAPQFPAVLVSDSEALNRVKIIEGLDLKAHHF